jgi:hypothetical protein
MKGAHKVWARVPHTKTRKNAQINKCPETILARDGIINIHHQHQWGEHNPRGLIRGKVKNYPQFCFPNLFTQK